MKKYFVVSLPRSGTTTICEMARILGYNAVHITQDKTFSNGDFFADTPAFCPSLVRRLINGRQNRFIYINRDLKKVADSWRSLNLISSYNKIYQFNEFFDHRNTVSRDAYWEIMEAKNQISYDDLLPCFLKHREKIMRIIPPERLLIYNFDEGWEPFAKFLERPAPDVPVPHLNKT